MSIESPGQIGLAEPLIAAVDNGGTNTQVLILEGNRPVAYRKYDTPENYQLAVGTLHGVTQELTDGRQIDALGMAAAGKIINGRIVSAGMLEEYGWVDEPLQEDVAQAFRLESGLVVVGNDCKMAALAQRVANQKANGAKTGYIETISTGNGGAGFDSDRAEGEQEIEDEPGHEHLKEGATCGCGGEGHVEAHISGSGIEHKFGVRAEVLPLDQWTEVVSDTVEAHVRLLNRLAAQGFRPAAFHFFGSVATKQPYLILPGLHKGLRARRDELPFMPGIAYATHGDDSGLVGAGDAALERLAA